MKIFKVRIYIHKVERKTYKSGKIVTVHSMHSNTLRDAQNLC